MGVPTKRTPNIGDVCGGGTSFSMPAGAEPTETPSGPWLHLIPALAPGLDEPSGETSRLRAYPKTALGLQAAAPAVDRRHTRSPYLSRYGLSLAG